MSTAYINRIETSVPQNDIHVDFVDYACRQLISDEHKSRVFKRISELGGIEHRYSYLRASDDPTSGNVDADGVYKTGAFPSTGDRMRLFEAYAPDLGAQTIEKLDLGKDRSKITHLIVTSCTGMSAPGIDLQIADRCGLPSSVERTMVSFMGCYAAINALKFARHVVRSEPDAQVLVLNLELCTLHLKESHDLEQILSFFLFADGCAASLITSEPQGLALDSFHAVLAPETEGLITWNIGDSGFDMLLSGRVPGAIREALRAKSHEILRGTPISDIDLWGIHPGGRSVLDAVQLALELPEDGLWASRDVLRRYGNMSSPSVVFVLKEIMAKAQPKQKGCAMAFGPGLVAETMLFQMAG